MKKQLKKFTVVIALCMAIAMCVCACSNNADTKTDETDAVSTDITITFKNGDTTLGTVTAKAGETVTGYEAYESLDGYEFLGWFETPTFLGTSQKDLTADTFTEDATLYGSFKNLSAAEDTRTWTIVGSGSSPVLFESNWNNNCASGSVTFKATGNQTNEIVLTVDLFAGDQFQIIHDYSWDDQRGYGWFSDLDAECFENGGGLGGSDKTSNVNVLKDGNYTITLVTDPDDSNQDVLTITRNGDAESEATMEEETEFVVDEATGVYVKGSWVDDWSENKELTRVDGTNTYVITMDCAAGVELYFMIWEDGTDTGMGLKGAAVTDDASKALLEEADNVKVAAEGTYTFIVDLDAMSITVTQ